MTRTRGIARSIILSWACALGICQSVLARFAQEEPPAVTANAEAMNALEEIVKHYRELPGVEITCTMQIEMEQAGETAKGELVEARFVRLQNGDGIAAFRGFTCTVKDGTLWITHESTDHSYFTEKFDGSPYWPLLMKFLDLPFPHLAMLWGEADMSEMCMQLHTRSGSIVPTSVTEGVSESDGHAQTIITLASDEATLVLRVNAESRLIESMEHVITSGQFVRDGAIIRSIYTLETTAFKDAASAPSVSFAPGGRQRVDFVASLVEIKPPVIEAEPAGPGEVEPGGSLVGKPAPEFTLPLLEGGVVELAALRGEAVVIDFWAVWCPPCRAALPRLHTVADWAQRQGYKVRFIALNVWEHGNDDAGRNKTAGDFWRKNKFTLPVAMDHTGAVAEKYGVEGIPTTVVIRPDGTIHALHVGAGPNYESDLQAEIKAALEAASAHEGDDHGHDH